MKKRLPSYVFAFLLIIVLNFILPRMLPGDPFQAIYGEEAVLIMSEETKQELISRLALDQPLPVQFTTYLVSLLKGDLGYSYSFNASVWSVILKALPWTILLVGSALFLSTVIGILLGIESGWRKGSNYDRVMLFSVIILSGLPNFFIGVILLLIFSVQLGWLPLGGALTPYADLTGLELAADVLKHAALPVAALTLAHLSEIFLLTRSSMLGNITAPYILTAAAKGVRTRKIRYRHAGRNSLLPVTARLGVSAGRALAGALFIEIVFAYPGMGNLIYNALLARDYPLLQGIFLVIALTIITSNILADWLAAVLDPRLKEV